jgi:dTDP-glucose 4,6-dehydratase
VRGYWAALPAAQRAAFRFRQVSTDEVYGSLPPGAPPVPETAAYAPSNPYSATKAAADHLVRAWHHTYGLPVLVTHCTNNYGPHQYREKLLPCLLENACAGNVLPVYGDGLQVRDWLYVKDHTAALRRVLEAGRVGETYHIAAGNQPTNLEVVHTVCRLLDELHPRADGRSYAQQVAHVPDRPGHDRRYALDTRKLRQELGWRPEVGLEEGLRETVGWYVQNL